MRIDEASAWLSAIAAVLIIAMLGLLVYVNLNPRADIDPRRVEVAATFDVVDQVTVEFPAVVRDRIVKCTVVANTKRRTSAVLC